MDCYAPAVHERTPLWTVDKEARLISLYSQFALLWDHRQEGYYKREQRQHALRAIARGLDNEFEVPRVKDKIKSLRDYFVKELKKEEGMRQSGYVSPWTHFRSWEFLRPVIRATEDGPQVVDLPYLPTPPPCVKNEPNSSTAFDEVSEASGHGIRRAPANSIDVMRMVPENESQSAVDGSSCFVVPELHKTDVDALFCLRVLSELRQLSSYKRDLTKTRIERMLFEVKHMTEECRE